MLLATTLIEKIADPSYAKEYCNSYLKRKNTKLVKRSKIITHKLKSIESPSIADMKSVTLEHPETSNKLSKSIRQPKKVFQVGSGKRSNGASYWET